MTLLIPVPTSISPATTAPSIVNSVLPLPVANPPVLQATFVQPVCRAGAAVVLSIGAIQLHDLDGGVEQLSVALATGVGSDVVSVLFNNQILQPKASESSGKTEYALPVPSSSSTGIVNAEVMITAVDAAFRGKFNVSLTATSRELFSTNVTTASTVTSAEVGWFTEPVVYYSTPVDFWFESKQDTAVSIALSSIRERLLHVAGIPLSSGELEYGPCRLSWRTDRAQAVFVDGDRTLSRDPVGGGFGALIFAEDETFEFGSSDTMIIVPARGYSGEVTVSLTVNAYVPVLGQVYVLSAALRVSVTPAATSRLFSTAPNGSEVIRQGFNRELDVVVSESVASSVLHHSDAALVSFLVDAMDAAVHAQGPFWRYDGPAVGGSRTTPNGIFVLDAGCASVNGTLRVLPPRDYVGSLPVAIQSVAAEGKLIPSGLVTEQGGRSADHAWLTVFSTSIVNVVLPAEWNHAQAPRFGVEYASSRVYEDELAMVWISELSVAESDAAAQDLHLSVEVLLPQSCNLSVSVNGLTMLAGGSERLDDIVYTVVQIPVDSKAVYVTAGPNHWAHVEVYLRASVYAFSSWNWVLASVMLEFLTVAVNPAFSVTMTETSVSENGAFSGTVTVVPTKAELYFRVEAYVPAGSITLEGEAIASSTWSATTAGSAGNLLSSFSTQWGVGVGESVAISLSLIPIETMSGSLSVDVVVVASTVDVAQYFFMSDCYLGFSNRKDVFRCLPPIWWKSIAVASQSIPLEIYPVAQAPRIVVTPAFQWIKENDEASTTVSNWMLADVDGSESMYLQLHCIFSAWQKVTINGNAPSAITSTGYSTTYDLLPLGVYRSNESTGDLRLQLTPPSYFSGYIDCRLETHSIDHSDAFVSEDAHQVPLSVTVFAEATVPLVSVATTTFTAVEDDVVVCDSVEASLVDTDGSEMLFLAVDLGEYDVFVTAVTWRSDEFAWPFWTLADGGFPATVYRSPSQRIVAAEAWRVDMRGSVEIALVPGYSGELQLSITSVAAEKLFLTWEMAWNTAVASASPIGITVSISPVSHVANMTLSPVSAMTQPLMEVPIQVAGSTIDTDGSEVLSTHVTVNRSAVLGLYVPTASENLLTDADTVTLPDIPAQAVYQVDRTFTVVARADFVGFFMVNVTVMTTELATGETKAVSMITTVLVTPVDPVVRVSAAARGLWNEFVQLPFQRLDKQQEVANRDHFLLYVENRTQVADIYAGFQRLDPVPLGDVDVYEVPYTLQDVVSVRPLEYWYGYMQLFAIVTTVAFDIASAPNRTAYPGTGDGIAIMDLAVTIHPQPVSPSYNLAGSDDISVAGKPFSLTFDGVAPHDAWGDLLAGGMMTQLALTPFSVMESVSTQPSVTVDSVALRGLGVYGVYSTGNDSSETHLSFLVDTKPSYTGAFIATVTTNTTDILQQSVVTNISNFNVQLIGEPDRGALGFDKAIRVFQVKYNQDVTFRLADLGLMSELTDLESVQAFILADAVDAVAVGSTQLSGEVDSHWGVAVSLGDLRYELYGSKSPQCLPTEPSCSLNRVVTVTPRKSAVQTFDITMRIISRVSANSSSFNSLSAVTTFARCRVVVAPAPNTTPLLVLNSTTVAMGEDVAGSFILVEASTPDYDESKTVEVEISFDPQFLDGIQVNRAAVATPKAAGPVVLISRTEAVVSATNRVVSLVPHRNYAGNFTVQVSVSSIERSTGASYRISTNVSVNVAAIADAPVLKLGSVDIRVNQSVPGELTIISVALTDDDSSESLRLEVIDPSGSLQAVEVSGGAKFVKDSEGNRFVLTPLPLTSNNLLLRLNGTASWFGSTQLQLNAVSREVSNGNEAVSSINVALTVLPVADPPFLVVENTRGLLAQATRVGLVSVGIPTEAKLSASNLTVYLLPKSTDVVEVKWQSQVLSLETVPDVSSSAVYRLPSNSTLKQPTITVNTSKWVSSISFEVTVVSSINVSSTSQRTTKVATVTFGALQLSATSYNLTEGANATLSLTMLSAPLSTVKVTFNSSSPLKAVTAPVVATFTSTDWNVTKNIQILAVNNYLEDENAAAMITAVTTSTDPVYTGYPIPAVAVQVLNDDVAGFVVYQGSTKTNAPTLAVAEARVINDTYNIVLQAQPTADVSVTLMTSVSILVVAPTSVTFTPANWNVSKAIAVAAGSNDVVDGDRIATISSVVTSSDLLYAKKPIAVLNVKITETKDATPPPKILAAKFLDTAIGLTITFDRAVDRTTFTTDSFACSALFDLPAADSTGYYGAAPVCTWQTGSTSIRFVFGQGVNAVPGSTLALRGNVLKSTAAAELTALATNITISAPDKPPQPQVLVSGPTSLGMCDDLFLDGSSSTGSGGRTMTYTWKLASTTGVTSASLDAVTAFLASAAATNNATIKVAASGLEAEGTYSFVLQAKNFFGKIGNSSEILVKKSGTALPSVAIKGGNVQSGYRANELVITASASYPSCSGTVSIDSTDAAVVTGVDMTFTWLQVTGDLTAAQFKSTSPNPRVLKLPARTLTVGMNYVFRLLVAMTSNSKVNNSADVQISVARTDLTALIAAGNRSIGVEQDLVLDASLSVDPDDLANAVPMKYAWACWTMSPTTQVYNVPCATAAGSTLALDTQAKVTVAANTVNPNALYKFTATVSKDSRSSTTSTFISMTPGSPPQVSIEALGVAKVNSNDRVVLKGKAVSKLPVTKTEWAIVGASDATMKSIFAVPQGRLVMLLSEGKLTPGVSYKFQLNATDSSGQTGSATLTVVANSPPSSGSLSVTPSVGYALEDKFSVLASDWVDEDLPLKYTFKYIKGSAYSGETEIALGASTPDALFVSQLGLGGGENNTVTLVVYVQDALGASTRVTKEIQVKQMEVAAADQAAYLANKTSAVLAEALTGDPGKVLNTINALADMVNGKEETPTTPGGTVPTPAPTALKSCPTSNHVECAGKGSCLREPPGCLASNLDCSVTCECTSGFYGDNCALDEAAMAAKSAALGSLLGAMTTASASVDVTDVGALEQQAASVVTLTKSATILDSNSQKLVLNFMENILAAPVLTPAATTAVGNTISNLLEIDNSGAKKAATAAKSRRLEDASAGSSSTNTSDEFSAEKARVAQVASTIGKLQAAMISSAVAGEDPVTLVTKNLRLVGARDAASQFEGRQVQLPLTDAQVAANYTPASTTVPSGFAAYLTNQTNGSSSSAGDEEDPVVDFQSSVFAKNPYAFDNTSINSRVMTVKVSSNGEEVAVSGLKTPFRLLMRNLEPITLASNASDNSTSRSGNTTVGKAQVYTFYCLEGTIDIKSFNCTDIVEPMTVQCNGSSYAGEATCPVRQPACKYWDTASGTWSSDGCEAAGTTDDGLYTICECTHLTDFSSEVSQSVSLVTEHFMNVVTHEVTAEDVAQNLLLILVLAGFFFLYIVSFFYVNRWDYRDRRKAMRASRQLKRGAAAPEKVKLRSLFQEPEYVQAKSWQSKLRAVVFGFGRGLKQNHKILSIIFKYHESFSRPQRLTVVFTLVASKMFTNALLYQLKKGPKTLGSAIVSAVITTLFMLPVGFVFMMLFKKAGRMQKQIIRYQVEDDAGNVVEVETDAYGRAKEYSPAEQLSMDFAALARGVNMSALCLIHDKLRQPREDGSRDPLETRSGQVCRGIFLALYNCEAGAKSPEHTEGDVNGDPLAGVLVQIKSHLQEQKRRGTTEDTRRQSRLLRALPPAAPILPPPVVRLEEEEEDPVARKALALDQLCTMLKRDGGAALINGMLKFDPLLVSAASTASIAEICTRLDVLEEEEEEEDEVETAEGEEVKAVLALQAWLVKCNECCEAQEANARVVVAKAQAELQRTEKELRKLRIAIGNQFDRRVTEAVAKEMNSPDVNDLIAKTRQSVRRVSRRPSGAVKAEANARDDRRRITVTIKKETKGVLRANNKQLVEKRKAVKKAKRAAVTEQRQLKREAKHEQKKILEGLRGVTRLKKRLRLYLEAREERRVAALPLHLREAYLKEKEQLKKIRRTSRLLYNAFLRRQPAHQAKPLFPEWVVYLSYSICAVWSGWCVYFVLMFAFTIGSVEAELWVSSLFLGLALTYLLLDPMKLFFRMGLMPIVAAGVLANSGFFSALSSEPIALGAAAVAAGASGMAGYIAKHHAERTERRHSRRLTNGNKLLAVAEKEAEVVEIAGQMNPDDDDSDDQVEQVQALTDHARLGVRDSVFGEAASRTNTLVEETLTLAVEMVRPSVVLEQTPVTESPPEDGDRVRTEHKTPLRTVTCRAGCGMSMQARGRDAHERSHCRLTMCECGKMILTPSLEFHRLHECSVDAEADDDSRPFSPRVIPAERGQVVLCRLPGCTESMRIGKREAHERHECTFRLVPCPRCGVEKRAAELSTHISRGCDQRRQSQLTLCACGKMMRTEAMDAHRKECSGRARAASVGSPTGVRVPVTDCTSDVSTVGMEACASSKRSPSQLSLCPCGKLVLKGAAHSCTANESDGRELQPLLVNCRLPGCNAQVRAAHREGHERLECSFRMETCTYCGVEKQAAAMETHECERKRVLRGPRIPDSPVGTRTNRSKSLQVKPQLSPPRGRPVGPIFSAPEPDEVAISPIRRKKVFKTGESPPPTARVVPSPREDQVEAEVAESQVEAEAARST